MWWSFRPYVSVASRRQNALREISKLEKSGRKISPVQLEGRTIANTFWGKAWCRHLESYSDYANRLPRGRSYLRNGSVLDLQIEPGKISALVSGSEVYKVVINIKPLAGEKWAAIRRRLSGEISSILELLRGHMSDAVMAVVTDRDNGMFPAPDHIDLNCSCPDTAGLCKHLAATLYGVGARLDTQPELLFKLRQVNHLELVPTAATVGELTGAGKAGRKTIAGGELADVFGLEIDQPREKTTAAAATKPLKSIKISRKNNIVKKRLPARKAKKSGRLRKEPKPMTIKTAVRPKAVRITPKHPVTAPKRKRS
jgi:uncharacterized Zn finger protein